MQQDELDKFINQILDEKQLSGVNDEVRVQLVADLKERLTDQINRALIEAIPEQKIDELNNLLDDDSVTDEQIHKFITDSGVDDKKVALETMLRFGELYLGRQGIK